MAEIPQYNITPQRRYQPTSVKDKLGSLQTTPSNIGKTDQASATEKIQNQSAVAQMDRTLNISSGANVETTASKQASTANKINSGKNTMIVSKADVAKASGGRYPTIEDANLDANTVKILQKQLDNIQQNNNASSGPTNIKSEVPVSQRNSYNDWLKVNVNKDGSASIENYGVWDKLTGRTYGNSYITGWNPTPKMFASMALPLLTYSNAVNSMDTQNQLIFGTKVVGQMLDAARGGPGTNILTDTGVMAVANLADMAHNWSDRNKIQQAQSIVDSMQSTAEFLGYDTGPIMDGYSLFNFGYGTYQVMNNWDKMTADQRAASTFYLTLAGTRAYTGAESLYEWGVQNGLLERGTDGALTATESTQAAYNANALGNTIQTEQAVNTAEEATEASQVAWNSNALENSEALETETASEMGVDPSGITTAAAAIYSTYDAYKSWDNARKEFGHGTADSRKAMARTVGDIEQVAGTVAGAIIGSLLPVVGTTAGAAIGSFIGRITGTVDGLILGSIKNGKSAEQRRRDMWRTSFSQAGIFYRMPLNDSSKTYAIKLADGSYYDVGVDGSGSRATDIRGNKKTFANPNLLSTSDTKRIVGKDGTAREVLPYEVDYTNNLDFGASLMLNGMIMPIGGSAQKNRAKEVGQMLGYMTNGVTSNCGREFTQDNWNTMVSNVRLQYANVGITNKSLYGQSLAEAYFTGRMSYEDYQTGLLTMGWIYDEDGYRQASSVLGALGKLNGQDTTSGTVGVAATSPITGDTRGIVA